MLVAPIARVGGLTALPCANLRLPPRLIQLLISIQGETEIVGFIVRNGFVGVDDLADYNEIVSLCFIVDDAAASKSADDVIIDTSGLLARDAGEFQHSGNRAFLILAKITQCLDSRTHEATDHLRVFFDKFVCRSQRAPGVFHLVAHEKHFAHSFIETDVALLDAAVLSVEQRYVEESDVFIGIETVFGEDLLQHEGRNSADAGGGDLFALKIFRTGDLRSGNKPLKNSVVCRGNDLERSIAPSNAHQRAGARASEMNITAEHGLDAGRGRDKDDSLIQSFFLHVALLLSDGIEHHLKTSCGNRHIDGLEWLGRCDARLKERQTQNYSQERELTQPLMRVFHK